MKLSIITCTWNSEPYIAECVRSVEAQEYDDIEHIFVDGGSTDGTLDRIERTSTPHVVIAGVRGGISKAMNAGIAAATGDVIAHLHSDDYYVRPDVLGKVARVFRDSCVEWMFGRCLQLRNGVLREENYTVPRYSYRRLLKGNFVPHPATFIRRRLFERVGLFDETLRYAMDYDMWLRLGRVTRPVQLNEHLAVFRAHDGSLSSANPMATFEEDFQVRMRHAPSTPWDWACHFGHYWVRRRRIARGLRASGISG